LKGQRYDEKLLLYTYIPTPSLSFIPLSLSLSLSLSHSFSQPQACKHAQVDILSNLLVVPATLVAGKNCLAKILDFENFWTPKKSTLEKSLPM
jgi:hypothetical protein